MKNKIIYALVIILVTLASCSKDYTVRPSLAGVTISNFGNTPDEIRAITSTLYSGLPWAGFMSRGMDDIGEVQAGNELVYAGNGDYSAFVNFSQNANTQLVGYAWTSSYKVGGWASSYIQTLELKKTLGGNASFIDPAIAECHFMRGYIYFFIGRAWGAAPIVTDPGAVALGGNYNIPRYKQADVLRFALNELKLAEAGLPESDVPGRVTKYSAKAVMAKLYLYRQVYDSAAMKALEVINSGKYSLVQDYQTMFNSSSMNNNSESIFAIQYQNVVNPWGAGNQLMADRGPNNLNTDVASMWELYRPTLDIIAAFEPGDQRRKASIMEHGWTMPSWKPQNANAAYNAFMANGYKYDTLQNTSNGGQKNDVRANIAKYVVGPGSKYGGEAVNGMNTGQNFMVIRYADVLLMYAEAVLGTQASTSDAKALDAFNKVRARAGLGGKTSLTKDMIMKERRVELCFEGDYWFDIQRQGFAKAKQIIEAQNRAGKDSSPLHVTFTEQYMYLPVPNSEILQDPELQKEPVSYPFK